MRGERYSRNTALFGAAGQARVAGTRALIAGLGGLGCHVGQQLAYLGVTDFGLIDHDITTPSSLNRLVGSLPADVGDKTAKVAVSQRLITAIQPAADVWTFPFLLQDERT